MRTCGQNENICKLLDSRILYAGIDSAWRTAEFYNLVAFVCEMCPERLPFLMPCVKLIVLIVQSVWCGARLHQQIGGHVSFGGGDTPAHDCLLNSRCTKGMIAIWQPQCFECGFCFGEQKGSPSIKIMAEWKFSNYEKQNETKSARLHLLRNNILFTSID